jgi:hypothetical protein
MFFFSILIRLLILVDCYLIRLTNGWRLLPISYLLASFTRRNKSNLLVATIHMLIIIQAREACGIEAERAKGIGLEELKMSNSSNN